MPGGAEVTPPIPPLRTGPIVLADRPGSVQSSLRLALPAVGRTHPDHAALQLANLVFGGYFSSRWVENIREDKGYTYSPHSVVEHSIAGSSLILSAEVATEVTAAGAAGDLVRAGPRWPPCRPAPEELEQARQYALGSLLLGMSTQAGLAGLASTYAGVRAAAGLPGRARRPAGRGDPGGRRRGRRPTYLAPAKAATVVLGDADRGRAVARHALHGGATPRRHGDAGRARGADGQRRDRPVPDRLPRRLELPPLARSTLDRAGQLRTDPVWLDEAWGRGRRCSSSPTARRWSPATGWCWSAPTRRPTGERLFLGVDPDGTPYFAVVAPLPPTRANDLARPYGIREVGHVLSVVRGGPVDDRGRAGELARPAPLLARHRRSRRRCATAAGCAPTRTAPQMWPRTDPAVIVLVHDGVPGEDGLCLLGSNAAWSRGRAGDLPRYSCLAGFVEPGESAEQTLVREVAEEVGVHVSDLHVRREPALAVPGLADARLPRDRRPGRAAQPRTRRRSPTPGGSPGPRSAPPRRGDPDAGFGVADAVLDRPLPDHDVARRRLSQSPSPVRFARFRRGSVDRGQREAP